MTHPCPAASPGPMPKLAVTGIKAFVPPRDFELSQRFLRELGFTRVSEGGGVAQLAD